MGTTWATRVCAAVLSAGVIVAAAGTSPAGAQSGAIPKAFSGRWTRTITAADWNRAISENFGVGVFSMIVKPSGALEVHLPDSPYAWLTTRFAVLAGGRLTIGSLPYCAAKTGVYSWKLVGRLLTIKILSDPNCAPREGIFVGVWKKK